MRTRASRRVQSGLYFGFLLGIGQAAVWAMAPRAWTLPAAGALVGYVTNWLAIKLLFEPAEPTPVLGGAIVLQGLFEKRQKEVSEEFSAFLAARVITSPRLFDELANGTHRAEFEALLRRVVPFIVPDAVVSAATNGLRDLANEPMHHPTHLYVAERLCIEPTLCHRLQQLSPSNFENLLHELGIETLLITGCVTNYCVETTVRDAADRGFSVVVIDEAVAGFDQASHDATLASFRGGFAAVVRTADQTIALLNEIQATRNPRRAAAE